MTSLVFQHLNPAKTKAFVKRINAIDPSYKFQDKTVKILSQPLLFAPGWFRYDCEDYSCMPHLKHIFIANDDVIRPMVYTTDPVASMFQHDELSINGDNVRDYMNFYLVALNTGGENLRPIGSVDDVSWREDLSPTARKSLDKELTNYPVIKDEDAGLSIKMAVIFRQSLMAVTFFVDKVGNVKILDRATIIEDLPIINDLTLT